MFHPIQEISALVFATKAWRWKGRSFRFGILGIRCKFPNESPQVENDSELLEMLQDAIGIQPAPWDIFESEAPQKEMILHTEKWSKKRSSYEYEIDGIVFKLDSLNQRERLGSTAHHPRWALAWKFPSQEAESVLLDVDWQTGRTGTVTPVARIAPQM